MKRSVVITSIALLMAAFVCQFFISPQLTVLADKKEEKKEGEKKKEGKKKKRKPAGPSGPKVLAAANKFLESLTEEQKKVALFELNDNERTNWHFIPRTRKGLALKAMKKKQQRLALALLRSSMSGPGFKKAEQTRQLEAVLFKIEGPRPNRSFTRDTELYHISIFGTPSEKGKWGWRYEGHHLSLNFSLEDGKLSSATPLFFGINPAQVPDEEKFGKQRGLRVLGKLEDAITALGASLNDDQKKAILGKGDPEEVKETTKAKYEADLPKGLAAKAMDKKQKKLLRTIITEHTRNLPADVQKELLNGIKEGGNNKVQIAWRGSLDTKAGHSFLVYGPTFIISYANFQNNAKHIHTGFRARSGEFGLK